MSAPQRALAKQIPERSARDPTHGASMQVFLVASNRSYHSGGTLGIGAISVTGSRCPSVDVSDPDKAMLSALLIGASARSSSSADALSE